MELSEEESHGRAVGGGAAPPLPPDRDAPSHDGGRAGYGTDGDDDLLHSILSAKQS